jgi:hypothetical protein
MRLGYLVILLSIFVGIAGASTPIGTFNAGHYGGDTFKGPVVAPMFYATTTPTDSGATVNGWGQISVQTIAVAESTDTSQIKVASKNSFNSTTHFLMRSSGVGSSFFVAQPDVCRNIIATMNRSTTGSVKLTGTDISGASITENLTWAGESGAKASAKAFKTITQVDGTCAGATAQFLLGTGDLLGLNEKLTTNTVLFCALDGTREGTAPAVTVSSTVLSLNTIDTSSAPGGAVTKVWMVIS